LSRSGRARRVVLLAALAAALLALLWERETRGTALPAGSPPVTLIVEPGMTVATIAERLHDLGAVHHPLIFRLLVMRRHAGTRLKAGEYLLASSLSPSDIVDLLVRGAVVRRLVTFPEGRTLSQMALLAEAEVRVSAEDFLRAARDPAGIRDLDPKAEDLEGYLFPDTYDLPRAQQPEAALVQQMLARFRTVVGPYLPELSQRNLTLREAVTLASVVELETARPEERPRIAAVFLNRLKKKMPLQADPTVIYALRRTGLYDGNIRKRDLALDSPYNTYRFRGLPPGPIASPGRASIEAVLHPAPVDDLYFVSRNDGTHEFNARLSDHERAVDRYQRRRAGTNGG
jgi:UPF0755 protein